MDLYKCYQVLGVSRGCTWEELRTAYRRQVQKHHPDRFQQQPEQHQIAKERMLELNNAFNTLEEYYKKNGVLPAETLKKPATKPLNKDYSDQARSKNKEHRRFEAADVKSPKTKQTTHKTSWGLIIVLAVVGYYFFWENMPQTDDAYSSSGAAGSGYSENGNQKDNAISNTSKEKTPATAGNAQIYSSPHNNTTSPISSNLAPLGMQDTIHEGPFFTYGDNLGKVFEIQGIPTRTVGDIWFYGTSEVHFNKGVVVSWYSSPENPLKAK